MGFIGSFFIAAAVVILFIAAAVGVVFKLKAGEPLFGDTDGKRNIQKYIVTVFAVIGAFFMLPYVVVFLVAAVIWVLWRLIRGKSLDKETVLETAALFLAAVGAIFSVLIAYGGLSALIKG